MYVKEFQILAQNMYNKNTYTIRQISTILDISKSTIHRWIRNRIKNKINRPKIIAEKIKYILKSNGLTTLKQIKNDLEQKYNINVSVSLIHLIIKQIGYSYKRVSRKIYGKTRESLIKEQNNFRKKFRKISDKQIICIDETYFYSNDGPKYGYALKGAPINCHIKSNPKKYSLLMAITNDKIIAYELYETNINKYIYENFITKIADHAKNKYILMDNVSFHKTKNVKQIAENKSIKLMYIPPYSPNFNSIENVFSIIKQYYRKRIYETNEKESVKIIQESINRINKKMLKNIYRNTKKE